MSFEYSTTLDHPADEVFAWHARPGAVRRLVPPWQPVRVVAEAESLRDGEAVLALPGGLRWRARHVPEDFEPGRRFVDVLDSPVLGPLLGWRHVHSFEGHPEGTTTITDTVGTRVPARLLHPTFAYRERQLRGDLAAHARWGGAPGRPLTVAVTGSSGTIGTELCALLSTGGHRVIRLVRAGGSGGDTRLWEPDDPAEDLLDGADAVVHLAGETIAGRFTSEHKRRVRESRIGPTRRLAELAGRRGTSVFVCASAIGFYGAYRGDEILSEDSGRGEGFLAELVSDWEDASRAASAGGCRVVNIRTGIVQTPRGGALKLLLPLFRFGAGGKIGDGRGYMAWIGIDDLTDIYLRALVDPSLEGPVNATAPEPVTNAEYTRVLAGVLRRPAIVPVPRAAPAALLGREGAAEVALASQRVVPGRLEAAGHPFRHGRLEPALRHLLGRSESG